MGATLNREDSGAGLLFAAFVAAGAVGQLVAAKAARDAAFLASFEVRWLPYMVIGAAVASLGSALVTSRALAAWTPARVVPIAFGMNAGLYAAELALFGRSPGWAAIALYLHVALLGATSIASFWTLVNESFDPRSAKRKIGRIAMGGTLGGAAGGLVGWQLGGSRGVPAMLTLLAALNLSAIPAALAFARSRARAYGPAPEATAPSDGQSGFAVLREVPYLRLLALLVAVCSATSALLDYVMSANVVARIERGPKLVAFFALFHMTVGLVSFGVQAAFARRAVERIGLAGTVALLPAAVLAASVFGLLLPGLPTAVAMRGTDALMTSSLYRPSYELLYTPLPSSQKRKTKLLIDVGVDRLGTAIGGGVVLVALWAFHSATQAALIVASLGAAAGSLLIAARLHRGYVQALAASLKSGKVKLSATDVFDAASKRTLAETSALLLADAPAEAGGPPAELVSDPWLLDVQTLHAGAPEAIRRRLAAPLGPELVPLAIGLLGRDELSRDALRALRALGPRIAGQLVDALLDPGRPVAVRRRVPRVLETCATRRAADGLTEALFDPELEVRHQAAWALERLTDRAAGLEPSRDRVLDAVRRELELVRGDPMKPSPTGLRQEDLVSQTLRGIEHAMVVLSLVLEREPLQLAYRALTSGDSALRGTALEYFENVLPEDIREACMPLLDRLGLEHRGRRDRQSLRAELLKTRAG